LLKETPDAWMRASMVIFGHGSLRMCNQLILRGRIADGHPSYSPKCSVIGLFVMVIHHEPHF
jgi:hypothetical protein